MGVDLERDLTRGRAAATVVAALVACLALAPAAATAQASSPEALAAGHQRMVRELARLAGEAHQQTPFLDPSRLQELRRRAALLAADAPLEERVGVHLALGMEELQLGTAAAAVAALGTAYRLFPDPLDPAARDTKSRLAYYLGLAHLRLGERANCVLAHSGESCIFPIRGGGVHADPTGAREAVRFFREVLHTLPPASVERVAAKWLLNIAFQTLGVAPEEIPASEALPPQAFAAEADFPRFENVAPALGVDTVNLAGGAVVEDFDGDGFLDLVTSSFDAAGPMHYFANAGDGSFRERTHEANLDGITGGLNMMQADYDGDGDIDLFVLRGAWLGASGRYPNSLLSNDGQGRFTDVTFAAGLAEENRPTQAGAWADYDNDGDLDLYVGNEHLAGAPAPGQLFANDGAGRFTDVAARAGVENLRFAKGVAWGDFDGDRWPDLYVSNLGEPNRLYRNLGDGTFADVAEALEVTGPTDSFAAWFWDFDNDGALDLYVTGYPNGNGPQRLFLAIADDLGIADPGETGRLYRGDGRGGFTDVTAERGLARVSMPMGANFGDLDNDGFLDVYLGTGYPSYDGLVPNELYWNRGGERFLDVTAAAGMGHLQKGHGVAFADLDNDGDQDVFEQMGGFYPEDDFADALYENPGFGNAWLKVKLVGVQTNRCAVGARVTARFSDRGEARQVVRWIGSGGSFGADPLAEHLGLGGAERVDELTVYWPTSDSTQTFRDLAAGQAIEITEGVEGFRALTHRPTPLRKHRHP